jgi:multiple sugar transport system ATP-binding protein
LLDEPLSNLDAPLKARMRQEISKLHERLGMTMIYVTHDQVDAMSLGQRIALMKAGELQQVAEPTTLYRGPKNLFVAGFFGAPRMNFFTGTVMGKGGKVWFEERSSKPQSKPAEGKTVERVKETSGTVDSPLKGSVNEVPLFAVEIPGELKGGLSAWAGKDVIMGLRPENIKVAAGEGALRARVERVEQLGAEVYVHARTGGHVFTVRTDWQSEAPAGDLHVQFNMRTAKFFDVEDGRALISC